MLRAACWLLLQDLYSDRERGKMDPASRAAAEAIDVQSAGVGAGAAVPLVHPLPAVLRSIFRNSRRTLVLSFGATNNPAPSSMSWPRPLLKFLACEGEGHRSGVGPGVGAGKAVPVGYRRKGEEQG